MLAFGRPLVRVWAKSIGFGLAYFLCAYISRTLTTTLNFEAGFWLPSGLFLGVLLLNPPRQWPWLILASLFGSLAFNLQGSNWPFLMWFAAHAANTVTALVGALLVRRFGASRPALRSVRELIALFLFGALLSNTISATVGASLLRGMGIRTDFWDLWRPWLLSNVVGVVLLTPTLLAWQGVGSCRTLLNHRRRLEALLLLATLAVTMVLGARFHGAWLQSALLQYLPIPFVIWAAIRFETRGVTVLSLVLAVLLGWFAIWSYGSPSVGLGPSEHNARIQLNLVALSFFGLFPAIVIAAHRRATEALQASEARYTRALHGAGDGLWEWNILTGSSYYSARWREMLGFTEAELTGDRDEFFVTRIHPEDLTRVQRALRAHLDDRAPYDVEFRLRMKDHSYRWFRSRGQAERNAQGEPVRVAGTLQDVTDRVQAEDSLRESRRALATLMGNLPGMAYRCRHDEAWSLEFASAGARELTGYSSSELVGGKTRYAELIHRDDFSAAWNEVQTALRDRRSYRLTYRILAEGGVEKWVWEQGMGVTANDGRVLALEGFITDITDRKRLEQQVLRAQRRESIGTLTAGVAHNLNNMLVPIVMGAELLRLPGSKEDNERVLENIESSARRAADLVKQLLAFGRGLEGARARVLIPQVVKEVESIIAGTFPKNITFQPHVAEDLWPVVGDVTQLHQVLLNLCLNARDAMPEGGLLTLRARNVSGTAIANAVGSSSNRIVCVEVADTGCGMTREVSERIFEPFFTTKDVHKGTGLGLSTVLGIVRSHGGSVSVTSEPGKGSCFTVHLPAMDGDLTPATERPPSPPAAGRGERILLVDDEPAVLDIAQRTLEAGGFLVTVARNGQEAHALYLKRPADFAAVITDMMMPGMDGRALVEELRKVNPRARIIAVSGLPGQLDGVRTQVNHVLEKPFEAGAILAVVQQVLRTGRPAPALSEDVLGTVIPAP